MVKLGRPFSTVSSRLRAITRSGIAQAKGSPSKVALSISKVAQSEVAGSASNVARSMVTRIRFAQAKITQSAVARSTAAQVRRVSATMARSMVALATVASAKIAQSKLARWTVAQARVAQDRVAQSKVVTALAASPRLTAIRSGIAVRVRAFSAASPKIKAIVAGAALVLITAVAAPAIAATTGGSSADQTAVTAQDTRSRTADTRPQAADRAARPEAAAPGTAPQGAAEQPATPAAAPSIDELHPVGIQGSQVGFTPTTDQMRNAQKIIQVGQAMDLPPRAWVIAVATSLQEATLNNYGHLGANNDHDSLGLFQQRPASGWGSPGQLQDPTYASKAFYKALTHVPNWDRLPLTDAAQAVQVSAYPDNYAKWEAHAGDIVDAFYGQGPLVDVALKVM